jgi:hypothetical protein
MPLANHFKKEKAPAIRITEKNFVYSLYSHIDTDQAILYL